MVLCFFSLLSSMITNVNEQQREIGVLLALGLRGSAVVRVFIHEAFLIVLGASLLGTAVGCIIAWTFGLQQALFTSIPAPFVVPWGVLVAIVLASAACAFFAAFFPTKRLLAMPITNLLRGM